MRVLCLVALLATIVPSATADPYWIAWEGDDFPENQGWERHWGDYDGPGHGEGAIRALEDGILTYDSLFDIGVYDYSRMELAGQVDPGPGETFVMEWCLEVGQVTGHWPRDPGVVVFSDEAWSLALTYGEDHIFSDFERVVIPIVPDIVHDYRVTSMDMREYTLYIDGVAVREGQFVEVSSMSEIAWGDFGQGAGSLHHWDYFRFGVVPEASTGFLLGLALACLGGRSLT